MTDDLARHEARAQQGIIEFAEEMLEIRDGSLYPDADLDSGNAKAAWKSYCEERWGMSKRVVDETIQALPVLRRLASAMGTRQLPSVSAAARVASLPELVQDAILDEAPRRNIAAEKATAVRNAQRKAEAEQREVSDEELVNVARAVKPKKAKKPKHKSKFTSLLAQGAAFLEDAADYASTETLTDIENEFAWSRLEKIDLQRDRIRERIYQPDHVRDWDNEAAGLLTGGQA